MRNILTLTNQIKYVRDIPQVLINFDEQAYSHLYFTVILARVLKHDSSPIADLFQLSDTCIEYLHDQTKEMGQVGTRNKYKKEATVFRLKLPKDDFLRDDHSIDLYKARQLVVGELFKIFGEIRDYNGGMISKQHELLSSIREELFLNAIDYDELLLENFFYSLAPVITRALLDPKAFTTLFLMLKDGLNEYKQEGYYLKCCRESFPSYALIIVEDISVMEALKEVIQKLNISSSDLSSAHVKTHGNMCLGYICCQRDPQKQELFFQAIENTLNTMIFQ